MPDRGIYAPVPGGGSPVGGASALNTAGYIPYVASAGILAIDKTASKQLFWDAANHRLAVGLIVPLAQLHVNTDIQVDRTDITTQYIRIEGGTGTGGNITFFGATKPLKINSYDSNSAGGNEIQFQFGTLAAPEIMMRFFGGSTTATMRVMNNTTSVRGYIQMVSGGTTQAGYLAFHLPDNTRLGYLGFGTADVDLNLENSAKFKILGGPLVTPTATPASAAATGVAGQWAWDSGFIYVAVAANTWKRVAIATW